MKFNIDILDRAACQRTVFGHTELQQLHPALCKCVNLYRRRKAQDTRYLRSGGKFGIYYHCKSQLVFQERSFNIVLRTSHTGDCLTVTRFFGNKTAKQIKLVGTRYRNKQIGAGNSRLLLSGAGSAVTLDSHYIKTAYNVIDNFSVGVNNRDVIVLLVELLGKSLTDLAAAYYDNVHDLTFFNIQTTAATAHR